MNTPLLNLIRIAYRKARYPVSPREPSTDEAATLIATDLAGYVLDWRRVEDWLPTDTGTVLMAVFSPLRDEDEVAEGWLEEGVWHFSQGGEPVNGSVYAWAMIPDAPKRISLVGFRGPDPSRR